MTALLIAMAAVLALCVVGIGYVVIHDWQPRPQRAADDDIGLFVAGIVMMFVFPLGGFIADCVLLTKSASSGSAIMVGSAAFAIGYAVLALSLV